MRICDILFGFLQLLNKNGNAELDESLIKKMQSSLIERNRDSNIQVQKAAIRASSLLQFPKDKLCPVISSFVYLLRHESLVEIKILVLNSIVINRFTYNLIKSEIIYDTNPIILNKALSLIHKKVPNNFIDPKFKKLLILRLEQNQNSELLEMYVIKWLARDDSMNENTLKVEDKCLKFIHDLDLENTWYTSFNFKDINYVDNILQKMMDIVYLNVTDNFESLILCLREIFTQMKEFESPSFAVYSRTLMDYLIRNIKSEKLDLNGEEIEVDFLDFYKKKIPNELVSFNNINCIFKLYDLRCMNENLEDLFKWLFSFDFDENHEILYELILSRFEKHQLNKLVWTIFKGLNSKKQKDLEKFLVILSIFLAKLTKEDYVEMEMLNLMNINLDIDFDLKNNSEICLSQNMVNILVENFLINQISNLEPRIRALCVRSIGKICINLNVKFESS